jgi:hypothetical protein
MPDSAPSAGYAIPDSSMGNAASAGIVRATAILADTSGYVLPIRPRRVVDQGELECCVSCALGAAMEVLNATWPALAPLFHYYTTRYEQGGADQDGSLYLNNALDSLAKIGICRGDLHNVPFTTAGATTKPVPAAYDDAKGRALTRRGLRSRFAACSSSSVVSWARDQLKRGCPIVLGFRLPVTYPKTFLNSRFEWLDPDLPMSDSGHVVLVVGYSDLRQALRIFDSRGPQKFDEGRWWMGYRVADSVAVREAYCLLP